MSPAQGTAEADAPAPPVLGLITIGQSPRPDLVAGFACLAPPGLEIRLVGALDSVAPAELDAIAARPGGYPLLVKLRDGSTREIERDLLVPYVERQAVALAAQGARALVLCCAGDFPDITSPIPLLLPGRVLPGVARSLVRKGRIGVVTPVRGQARAAEAKWRADGFDPRVIWASPFRHEEIAAAARTLADPSLELIVLDCMGHNASSKAEFARLTSRPVLLAQTLVARVAAELVEGMA